MRFGFEPGPQWLAALLAIFLTLSAGVVPAHAQTARSVATVTALAGEASVMRFGATSRVPLAVGAALFEGDQVHTAADGRLRIQLEDGSTLQLGESTELTLRWVLQAPALATASVILSVPSGIIRTIVEALLPNSIFELHTGTAITSVRGTDFIAEATPDATAVVALEGAVVVRNAASGIAGSVTLGAGEGTDVAATAPPTGPNRWGEARKNEFIARTRITVR